MCLGVVKQAPKNQPITEDRVDQLNLVLQNYDSLYDKVYSVLFPSHDALFNISRS
jgi:hypothetical protein